MRTELLRRIFSASCLSLAGSVALALSVNAPAQAAPQVFSPVVSPQGTSGAEACQASEPLAPDIAPAAGTETFNAASVTSSTPAFANPPTRSDASLLGTTSGASSNDDVVYEQDDESKMVAQAATGAGIGESTQNTDLAPVRLPQRTRAFTNFDTYRTSLLYKLPGRVFVNASCENSIRLETNVFQTLRRNRSDLIYRVLPQATIGYALTKTTRAAFNYFYFRDQYAINNNVLSRNIHSIGFRLDQDFSITPRTTVTTSLFARELLLSRFSTLSDILPSVTAVRRVGERGLVYGSVLGQIRFRHVLQKYQEFDQFYALGGIYRTPRWTFIADHTFITNFGKRALRQGPNNALWVLTYEAAYKIHPLLPIAAFFRAEPIFNIGANQAQGFAGVNVRIFGGLRFEVNKPPIFPVKIGKVK